MTTDRIDTAKNRLLPCPFCNGEAERITLEEDEPSSAGGDVICCRACGASSHVEFGFKENLESTWNRRTTLDALDAKDAEIVRLREALAPFAGAAESAIGAVGKTTTLGVLGAIAVYFVSWRDFTRARAALNPESETTTGSSKWGAQFPPSSCTAHQDCVHDGVCHDPNCGAPSQHGEGEA